MPTKPNDWWLELLGRDFVLWSGLPSDASYVAFARNFPPVYEGEGTALLGTRHVRTSFRIHNVDGYPRHVRVWFDGDRIVMVDAALPQLVVKVSDLLAEWKTPMAEQDRTFGMLRVPGGLKVYADRGAAAFIGPEGQLLSLELFPGTTLDQYNQRFRTDDTEIFERP